MDASDGPDTSVPVGRERGAVGGEHRGPSSRPGLLLVEDNQGDADLFRHAVEESDLEGTLRVATTGEEAITMLTGADSSAAVESIDLVVLDLNLPDRSGLEVLAALRDDPSTRRIPVLMLSTSEDRADVRSAYRLGANAYLVKRDDYEETVGLVEALNAFWLEAATLPE